MLNHSLRRAPRVARSRSPLLPIIAILMALSFTVVPAQRSDALAKAPPFATTVIDANLQAAPSLDADVLAVIPSGTDVELTGEAAPGYLAVYYGDGSGWVPASALSLGQRAGIDTAVTTQETPLLDAPKHDADVLAIVPAHETVILTGAHVDGYDAASHEGVGGWINERHLAR